MNNELKRDSGYSGSGPASRGPWQTEKREKTRYPSTTLFLFAAVITPAHSRHQQSCAPLPAHPDADGSRSLGTDSFLIRGLQVIVKWQSDQTVT